MTTYAREFGKRWDVRVPRADIKWLVGKLHVSVTDEAVEADIRQRVESDARFTRSLIEQSVRYAIECHHQNQNLYNFVMRGR